MSEATLQVRLYAANGVKYSVIPRSQNGSVGVLEMDARITQSEGFAESTLTLTGTREDYPALKRRRVIEYWAVYRRRSDDVVTSTYMYRGMVKRVTPGKTKDGLRKVTVKVFGLWSEISSVPCYKRYANAAGSDRASFFADIAGEFIIPRYPGLVALSFPVGSVPDYVDAYDLAFGDVVESLRQNLGQIASGADIDETTRANRIFFRPFDDLTAPARHTLYLPDRQGGQQTPEEDETGQATVLSLRGGGLKNGNLLAEAVQGNCSFESPQLPGETGAGNFLSNPSFESGTDSAVSFWDLIGDATSKDKANKQVQPFTGNRYLELDHVGEGAAQWQLTPAQPLVAGRVYAVDCRARRQNDNREVTGQIRVLWYAEDTGTTLISTSTIPVTPTTTHWDLFGLNVLCPAGAVAFRIIVECLTRGLDGTDAHDDGYALLIDDVRFFDPSQVVQKGWEFWRGDGDAFANFIRWDEDTVHWHGSRCVCLSVESTDEDGQDCHLRPFGLNRFTVTAGQEIVAGFAIMVPIGAPPLLVKVEIDEWNNDGVRSGFDQQDYTVPADGQWHIVTVTRGLSGDAAAQATAFLIFRSSGTCYVDAAFAYDTAVPIPDTSDAGTYIEQGNYRGTFRADSLFAIGSPIVTEATEVGDIVVIQDRPEITTDAEGLEYATAFFERYTLPLLRPEIETFGVIETNSSGGSTATMMPGQSVRVVGPDGKDLFSGPLPLVEKVIRFQDGKLTIVLYLSAEPRDPYRTIERMLRAQRLSGGTSGTSGGYSGGLSGGAGGGGGTILTITTASGSFPVAHLDMSKFLSDYDAGTQTLTLTALDEGTFP